ncbi:MAG: pyruvate kinase [Patescibacteria group bacterium]
MQHKRTKIVCTVGPASAAPSMLVRMMHAGMDVARLNFSHGTHDEHKKLLKAIRGAAKKVGKTVGILQDLQGPKIRVGELPKEGVELHKAEEITLTTTAISYKTGGPIPVTHKTLHNDVHAGHRILFDDGTIEVKVERVRGKNIFAKVTVPGVLKSHKGMNLPDSTIDADPFTTKDRDDLLFGVENGVDWVVLSFVTGADDIRIARKLATAAARTYGVRPPKIMAKVERRAALDKLAEIIAASDGVLLGRGDLGVEIPPEEVPVVQKDVVEACRRAGKPVIVATQMLNSMTDSPRATRAETADVANAVFDHADAVMLSAESASGRYPAVAVQAMAAVIAEAEKSHYDDIRGVALVVKDLPTALAESLHVLAASKLIAAVAVVASHGDLAAKANMFRLDIPLYVVCPDDALARQMTMSAGVHALVMDDSPASFPSRFVQKLKKEKALTRGGRVALLLTSGNEVRLSVIG